MASLISNCKFLLLTANPVVIFSNFLRLPPLFHPLPSMSKNRKKPIISSLRLDVVSPGITRSGRSFNVAFSVPPSDRPLDPAPRNNASASIVTNPLSTLELLCKNSTASHISGISSDPNFSSTISPLLCSKDDRWQIDEVSKIDVGLGSDQMQVDASYDVLMNSVGNFCSEDVCLNDTSNSGSIPYVAGVVSVADITSVPPNLAHHLQTNVSIAPRIGDGILQSQQLLPSNTLPTVLSKPVSPSANLCPSNPVNGHLAVRSWTSRFQKSKQGLSILIQSGLVQRIGLPETITTFVTCLQHSLPFVSDQ